ncbi:DNA-binding Lrp family transcriptional regulator [Paucibacter oligotrophus]|uniref:siroheme decarboxylase n=1 Tax=Roseateles oligotrophus TaxID=1769250 RepID=A0A840LFZ5_9BURK|nr:Lrp/AsnC family transcriptional regulator [Roseateles oligotrophus]MBB4844217.1 DNA-binding Lrp family transcriptional regulator [Roseateles oligotrophus]
MPSLLGRAQDQDLLNPWQQRFPLCEQPFAELAKAWGHGDAEAVMARLQRLREQGALSRIGGVWGARAAGAALLCAMAVPPRQLEALAQRVNAMPGVNHNYEREHHFNLWFVITGPDMDCLAQELTALEQHCGLATLRLPMERAYRINLGFDLKDPHGQGCAARGAGLPAQQPSPVAAEERGLAACVEQGLPLLARPYAAWAQALGWPEPRVMDCLRSWLEQGVLRRFGLIVRHHELGFAANAMCVFDVPDEGVDAHAALLARQPGVTLCYRRSRAEQWPYKLYCMVHGRSRAEVLQWLGQARDAAGLQAFPQAVLFSRRRFKQCGPSYFRQPAAALYSEAAQHA